MKNTSDWGDKITITTVSYILLKLLREFVFAQLLIHWIALKAYNNYNTQQNRIYTNR